MDDIKKENLEEIQELETREWLESLEFVLRNSGPERVRQLLHDLDTYAHEAGVDLPFTANTPYINTIPKDQEPKFPGGREIERRIKSLVRWNAMAMVVRANKLDPGIGGHISTYASAATLYEVAFNHFFRGKDNNNDGDQIYFQGHAAPGIYARAYLEGRLDSKKLHNFRHELKPGGGLSSYPHPRLMPDFWEFPTVSMGLGPIMAIYQARFNKYLENRGLKSASESKVWAFLGDGETDEPETLGAISLAAREGLDNLIFIINCNLQRLDGPVRGNSKIIQELEAVFRGAGWNAIKVVWGSDWDPLLEADKTGLLTKRMNEIVDGESQKYIVEGGAYIREHFFGKYPELLELVKHYTDEDLEKMKRGGHDPEKVYAAFKSAVGVKGKPTVILAKTVKGYGLGEAGEGKNITHSQKKLNEDELKEFRSRFGIPLSDEDVVNAPFYRPEEDSPEITYLKKRRHELGGYVPKRVKRNQKLQTPSDELFKEFYSGTEGREVSTTMVYVRILTKLLKDKEVGKLIVPIVPDEARTFGMEALFRQVGIYSTRGQLYEPVDRDSLLYYKEAVNGQILEEGITEAGSMSSFIAAGTAYITHGINMIPFFTFYSMFGFQRIGDLAWAAADMQCKGFLIGGTAGRTTLAGEGLQHQDGQSHIMAHNIPTVKAYDPAFAYELAVIIRDGIYRMYELQEDCYYYITVMNENYAMPEMPKDCKDGIIKGMYKYKAGKKDDKIKAHLLGSGSILNEVLKAHDILEKDYNVSADVWSVTSYKNLHYDALETDRWNRMNPDKERKQAYIQKVTEGEKGVFISASDYSQILSDSISDWLPGKLTTLGTLGFGRSESRTALRDFFEVDAKHIVYTTLYALHEDGKIDKETVKKAMKDLKINHSKSNPIHS
ncbi:MAG: pyruvate dehydrogenase (acetyl-transferring), homodimeric type [Ignavibacteriales bacterium]|nr:pyruvate dehydrogenase (acetyl-transferring), homodimeric type [Ignavibacteriales bacterium]MCB9207768.1 pyruvate dehydrogenase (acetyl-transferring), homodimeric type [Ignavibacteriales bacterium]MCB9258538.1 pyruvate dehydrogenase (acetyl-transferring), homodimeric type [Ignavibacteriales bacterium]